MNRSVAEAGDVSLLELLDRVIDHGVVLSGDITISVADVDLIYLGLRVMLTSMERAEQLGVTLTSMERAEQLGVMPAPPENKT